MAGHSDSSPFKTIPSEEPLPEATVAHCRLEPAPLRERIDWIRRDVLPDAESSEPLAAGPGRIWTFPDTPAIRARLERLVALERDCCRGPVTFGLEEDGARGGLRLVLRGMDPPSSTSAPSASRAPEPPTSRPARESRDRPT